MSGKTLLRSGNAAPAPAALTALALAGESEGTGRCQTFAESTKGAAKILFGIFYGVCLFNLKKSSLKILEFVRAVKMQPIGSEAIGRPWMKVQHSDLPASYPGRK